MIVVHNIRTCLNSFLLLPNEIIFTRFAYNNFHILRWKGRCKPYTCIWIKFSYLIFFSYEFILYTLLSLTIKLASWYSLCDTLVKQHSTMQDHIVLNNVRVHFYCTVKFKGKNAKNRLHTCVFYVNMTHAWDHVPSLHCLFCYRMWPPRFLKPF